MNYGDKIAMDTAIKTAMCFLNNLLLKSFTSLKLLLVKAVVVD